MSVSGTYQEIERKFLASGGTPSGDGDVREIEQGYLVLAAGDGTRPEVRLRRYDGTRAFLTVKGQRAGHGRLEVEIPLEAGQFDALWPLTEGRRLTKRRHRVTLPDGLVAECDDYGGVLSGLRVIEVEFPDAERARSFQPPPWFGREVSSDPAYANPVLASRTPAELPFEPERKGAHPGSDAGPATT